MDKTKVFLLDRLFLQNLQIKVDLWIIYYILFIYNFSYGSYQGIYMDLFNIKIDLNVIFKITGKNMRI